jgi:peptide deformylase
MTYDIVTFGNDVLRKAAQPVPAVTEEIRKLAADMIETMHDARGVGLAAEQVGREEALCVIDIPAEAEKPECRPFNAAIPMPLVLINPEILATEGSQRNDEGCLSFPDISASVTRANQVTVAFTACDGSRQTITAQGLLARAVLHETDHLKGILLVDRMSQVQKLAVAGKLGRLKKAAR